MIRMEPNVVMKYSEILDRFVKLRIFNDEQLRQLLQGARIADRDAYCSLIVNACVVNFNDEVLAECKVCTQRVRRMELEEQLYAMAVDLNPQLDIKRVVLPVSADEGAGMDLTLLEEEIAMDPEAAVDVRKLEKVLSRRIIGQGEAVSAVADAIKRAWVGIRDETRPIGTFLFAGQTGVGKTELAKVLAESLYGEGDHLVRVDCSEYSLSHEYAKLIGAPPGYVGHESGAFLTEEMARVGAGVVLFDEIEKAHEKVHNLLLQIMDEGFVTDSKGNRIRFAECVIILTSNVGVREMSEQIRTMGFGRDTDRDPTHEERVQATRGALRKAFRPEFLNRLDEVVIFRSLHEKACLRIVDLMLDDLGRRAARKGLRLSFTPGVRRAVVKGGYRTEFGARELKRTVRRLVEAPLAQGILDGEVPETGHAQVRIRGGKVVFEVDRAAEVEREAQPVSDLP